MEVEFVGEIRAAEERKVPAVAEKAGEGSGKGIEQVELSTYIYDFTGNPFVDAGIAALCALSEKKDPKLINENDLREAIKYISTIYLNWQKLGNLYTRNCILMNPSNKNTRGSRYNTYLQQMLERVVPASMGGSCASCGRREADIHVLRHEYPLTGSGDMLNYFSFFENGLPLCSACALALQFVPLYLISSQEQIKVQNGTCVKCGEIASAMIEGAHFCKKHLPPFKKSSLFLAHSHNTKLMMQLADNAITYIKGRSAPNSMLTFYSPFHISDIYECSIKLARHLISIAGAYREPVSIRLYSFVNSGQINLLDFIDLPSVVFSFIESAHVGGLNRNLNELFDNSSREIYRRLVEGETIALFFVRLKERKIVGGWELFELYLMEVEKMENKKLDVIKKMGKRIYEYLKTTDNFKKLRDLEAEERKEFMIALERIQKETLIWEIDDYPILFPRDDSGKMFWRETQRILLGYIYELMHKDKETKEVSK